jgi:hypothetical protein
MQGIHNLKPIINYEESYCEYPIWSSLIFEIGNWDSKEKGRRRIFSGRLSVVDLVYAARCNCAGFISRKSSRAFFNCRSSTGGFGRISGVTSRFSVG